MTKNQLEKILKENGWTIAHGAKHDAAIKDGTGTKLIIPPPQRRHTDRHGQLNT